MMCENEQRGRGRWVLPVVFAVLISTPLLGTFFHWDFYPLQNENRPMTGAPKFKETTPEQWPSEIDSWFKDHFGFRNTFIRRYNAISRDWFDRQPERVVMTDTGWLFTSSDGAMADFMGLRQLSDNELAHLHQSLEGRQRWLESQGIHYLWGVAPNKAVIYPEELPAELQRARKRDGIEQLMDYLDAKSSRLNRLDMRDTLLAHKSEGILYLSNDTHWNPLGSYYGYCAVTEAVRQQMPEVGNPVALSDCTLTPGRWTGDLITFVGDGKNRDIDYTEIDPPESGVQIVPAAEYPPAPEGAQDQLIVINPEGHGTAVVLHDSFGLGGWRKFLPYQFHKTVFFVAARPEIELFEQVIDTYHPDIIIEEQVQRMILHKDQPGSKTWTEAFKNP